MRGVVHRLLNLLRNFRGHPISQQSHHHNATTPDNPLCGPVVAIQLSKISSASVPPKPADEEDENLPRFRLLPYAERTAIETRIVTSYGHLPTPSCLTRCLASTFSATPSPVAIVSCPRNRASGRMWIAHWATLSTERNRAIGLSCYDCRMEKPEVISPRVLKRHRAIIKKAARKLKVSEAEVVRRALDAFSF